MDRGRNEDEDRPPVTEEQAERIRDVVWDVFQTSPPGRAGFLRDEEVNALEALLEAVRGRRDRHVDKTKDARESLLQAAQSTGLDLHPLPTDETILLLRLEDGRSCAIYILPLEH